jgi:hypothetical protein
MSMGGFFDGFKTNPARMAYDSGENLTFTDADPHVHPEQTAWARQMRKGIHIPVDGRVYVAMGYHLCKIIEGLRVRLNANKARDEPHARVLIYRHRRELRPGDPPRRRGLPQPPRQRGRHDRDRRRRGARTAPRRDHDRPSQGGRVADHPRRREPRPRVL